MYSICDIWPQPKVLFFTQTFLQEFNLHTSNHADGMSLHYYCIVQRDKNLISQYSPVCAPKSTVPLGYSRHSLPLDRYLDYRKSRSWKVRFLPCTTQLRFCSLLCVWLVATFSLMERMQNCPRERLGNTFHRCACHKFKKIRTWIRLMVSQTPSPFYLISYDSCCCIQSRFWSKNVYLAWSL